MNETRTPRQLFESFQACAMRRDGAAVGDLFAEDATMEFPFVPGGRPLRYEGREAIRSRATDAWTRSPLTVEEFHPLGVTDDTDPNVMVAEYEVRGTVTATKEPFVVGAVMVLEARDGLIASMREYLDPIALGAASQRTSVPSASSPAWTASRSPREVLRLYHRAMQSKSADDLADLYAVDGVHEFSFFAPGRPPVLSGREEVRASYREGWANHPLEIEAIDDVFVHDAGDPEVVIGQWRAQASLRTTGKPVVITGLLILRVRDGFIVRTQDFMDGLGVAKALGRPPFALAAS